MKTDKNCRNCPHRYGCKTSGCKPSIGECSVIRTDQRAEALLMIAKAVKEKGTVFLRHPVPVWEDFIGVYFKFTARRVSQEEGASPNSLDFIVGMDSFDDPVHTDNLRTIDIINIAQQL